MNKIIVALLTICILTSLVSAQKGYDELTREMEDNKQEIIKEVNSYNAAFDDVFKVISNNTSRLIMATIGSVIVCFFIFFFIYVRSRKHFTRLVTQVIIQQNQHLVAEVAAENNRYIKEVEGLVSHSQKLEAKEFVALDSYIEEAIPEAIQSKEEEEAEPTDSLTKAAIANGMGPGAPELPKGLMKSMDKSKPKRDPDQPTKKRKSRKEKRLEAEAAMQAAEEKVKPKPTLQELDQEMPKLEPLPKELKPLPKPPPKNSIFSKFKNRFKKKPKPNPKPVVKPKVDDKPKAELPVKLEDVPKDPIKTPPKPVEKPPKPKKVKTKAKKAPPPPKKKTEKKPGLVNKFFKIMTSSPNELMGKGGKDGSS